MTRASRSTDIGGAGPNGRSLPGTASDDAPPSPGRAPDRAEDHPVLITSWELPEGRKRIPMVDVKELLLQQATARG